MSATSTTLLEFLQFQSVRTQLFSLQHHLPANIIHRHRHPPVSSTPPPLSPPIIMMSSTYFSCLRCTDLHLQCHRTDIFPRSNVLCNECEVAGLDMCLFPAAVRLLDHRFNSTCLSCRKHHQKCIFMDVNDTQCIRCSKNNIDCQFTMNGKH